MPNDTCNADANCSRVPHARGMCSSHYGAWHRAINGRKKNVFLIACECCGTEYQASQATGRFCSTLCFIFHRNGPQSSPWPKPAPRAPKPKPVPFREERQCEWCDSQFTATVKSQRFCSSDHKIRAKRNRRRGRQYGSTSHFTWGEVMRLFLAFGRRCAYCDDLIVGQPDPDHVVPLSKGGSNSITNILPCCSPCNSDKRDLLLHEWAADRARRNLPPRTTSWTAGDPRIVHLTCLGVGRESAA